MKDFVRPSDEIRTQTNKTLAKFSIRDNLRVVLRQLDFEVEVYNDLPYKVSGSLGSVYMVMGLRTFHK